MSQKTYLITGANRGLGLGLLKSLISRPNTTVIAAVRDPATSSAVLTSLPAASGSKVIVVKLDASVSTDAAAAIKTLESEHGITSLDVVIANAGISKCYLPTTDTPISEVIEHHQINVVGTLTLFQATNPLLKKSEKPILVTMSSGIGSIGGMIPLPAVAYGASKAALNYVTVKIHFENEWLIAFAMNPGWVQTDMGNDGAVALGMKEAPTTLEDSISGMLNKIDNATRKETSGNFESYDGDRFPW